MTLFDTFDTEDQGEILTQQLSAAMAKALGIMQEDIMKTFEEAGRGPGSYISAEDFATLFSELISDDAGIAALLQQDR